MQATLTHTGELPESAATTEQAVAGNAAPAVNQLSQPSLAPRHEATGSRNPPHTSIESTMAPTSEFVRYFLLALPSRYIFRGALGIATDNKIGHPDNPTWLNRLFVPLRRSVDKTIDRFVTDRIEHSVNEHLAAHPLALSATEGKSTPSDTAVTKALATAEGKALKQTISRTLGGWDSSDLTHNMVQHAYDSEVGKRGGDTPKISDRSKRDIRRNIRGGLYGMLYGHALGVGSTALTAGYSALVFSDIKSIFSETVAYELGKDASDISFADIRKSDNRIVQGTVSNWRTKTLSRFATDALFFLSAFGKSERFADLALGVKGTQVLLDTWKREPTMFEQITTLIHNKINPQNGLGQPITAGDVFDLYQHYHLSFSPHKAFTNVIDNDVAESRAWIKGKVVFDRVTELLNNTYAYKHATAIDPVSKQPITRANFGLPKLIYLLGHDMIDPAKPAETLLAIEVANSVGMKAMRNLQAELKQGVPVEALSAKYLGTSPDTLLAETKANTPSASPSTVLKNDSATPDTLTEARIHQGSLVTPEHTRTH